jgi:uncharacterized protein (TIRG00374 family)
MRRRLVGLGIVVSLVFLYIALRGIDFDEFLRDLRQANLIWLLPGIGAYFLAVGVRAWRWSILLFPLKAIPAQRTFPMVVIGYMGNNIYPARIGELLRAYLLRRNEGVPIPSSLTTVLIERVMDGLTMLGFVLIGLPATPVLQADPRAGQALLLAAGVFAVASGALLWLAFAPEQANRLAQRTLGSWLPLRLRGLLLGVIERFVQGAGGMRSRTGLVKATIATLVIWLLETLKYACVALAFDLFLPFNGLMLVNGLSNLFTIIPGAPGAVGTFDAGGILGMRALGVGESLSAAYVLVLHVTLWLPVTALGLLLMLREGLRWSDLRRVEAMPSAPQ